MKIIDRLLVRNIGGSQLAGFVVSNFIGLAIVIAGLQFYMDVRSLWEDEDSFIHKDYIVVNRKVSASGALRGQTGFSDTDIADLEAQPWVRKVGRFGRVDYRVSAGMGAGGRMMSTYLFFESIPSDFIDISSDEWHYEDGAGEVPIILSRDYLALYNFGFASSAGLPQLTEQMIGSVPLDLVLTSDDGIRREELRGRIVGFSNRLNTILVPQEFMEWSNSRLGSGTSGRGVSRLIVDVSSPGDAAIEAYLSRHDMESAGGKTGSGASYFLNIVSGVTVSVGVVITLLSFLILLLSMALLMQKNRERIHMLIQLGCPLRDISAPYERITVCVGAISFLLSVCGMLAVRGVYISGIVNLSGGSSGVAVSILTGLSITLAIVVCGVAFIRRKVKKAF